MSTNLYQVRVLSVTGDQLTCQVTAVYPGEPLVPSPTLAVQFLWDVWDRLQRGWVNDGSLSFGVSGPVAVDEAKQLASQAAFAQLAAVPDGREEEWIRKNAGSIVRAVEVAKPETRPANELGYDSEDVYLSATFRIALTDPKWASHLRPGMEWRTTAYLMEEQG